MRGVGTQYLSLTADPVEFTSVQVTSCLLFEALDSLLGGLSEGGPSFKSSPACDTALHSTLTDMQPAVSSSSLSCVASSSLALALPFGLLPFGLWPCWGLFWLQRELDTDVTNTLWARMTWNQAMELTSK